MSADSLQAESLQAESLLAESLQAESLQPGSPTADSTRHGSEDSVPGGDNDRRDRTAGDQGHRVARADGGTGDRSLTDHGVWPALGIRDL